MPQLGDFVHIKSRGVSGTLVSPGGEPGSWWVRVRLSVFTTHEFIVHESDFGEYIVRAEKAPGLSDDEINRRLARAFDFLLSLSKEPPKD